MPKDRIPIGTSDNRRVYLDPTRRSYHLHVIGASGQGKSKFLEHCIRQDILAGHGVCLIDPHGSLYDEIVAWCAAERIDKLYPKIHLFDPTETNYSFRFNPLYVHEGEVAEHRRDNMVTALSQVWGGENSHDTPAIRTTLKAVFSVLIDHGLSLAEAFYLTSTADPLGIVEYLSYGRDNPVQTEAWEGWKKSRTGNASQQHSHATEFGGTRRRLGDLLDYEPIREMFSSYDAPIDFRACMDNNEIVLINLSPKALGTDQSLAIGALLLREMFFCAERRDIEHAKANPFYLYLDECAPYLTSDISRILAEMRKFGLHATMAHQWLQQLRDKGENVYQGVMATQNKVVFGGLRDEDAVIMADELFRTEYDLEIPIAELTKPGVIGYSRTWLSNWSEGYSSGDVESWSDTETESSQSSGSESTSSSFSQTYDGDGFPTGGYTEVTSGGDGSSTSSGLSSAQTKGGSTVTTNTNTTGASESLEPILAMLTGAVHGLENVRHMAISRLRSLPERNAVVKGAGLPSFDIHTTFIHDSLLLDGEVEEFKRRVLEASPYSIPHVQAKQIMELRFNDLKKAARSFQPGQVDLKNFSDDDDDGLYG